MPPPARLMSVSALQADEDGVHVETSDNDLLAAIAGGDRQAFTVLVRRYVQKMVILAQRVVFDPEQAREIAQEALLRVWLHAAKWDPMGTATFGTWLRRVTVNLAIDQRRRKRESVDIDKVDLVDPGMDGFGHVAEAHQKRAVKRAMHELPERQRVAVALYYYDDVSQAEAAEIMGLKPKAFDSLLVRARGNLKKNLKQAGYSDRENLS